MVYSHGLLDGLSVYISLVLAITKKKLLIILITNNSIQFQFFNFYNIAVKNY